MVKTKSRAQIEANYRGAAGTAATRYGQAIDTVEWQAAAVDGQALYEEQMRNQEVLARRSSGIRKVSDAEFRQAMRDKGASVISSRMTAAAGKQAANFEPYRIGLESVSLPARTSDPMINIDQRLKPIVAKMVEIKKAQG